MYEKVQMADSYQNCQRPLYFIKDYFKKNYGNFNYILDDHNYSYCNPAEALNIATVNE